MIFLTWIKFNAGEVPITSGKISNGSWIFRSWIPHSQLLVHNKPRRYTKNTEMSRSIDFLSFRSLNFAGNWPFKIQYPIRTPAKILMKAFDKDRLAANASSIQKYIWGWSNLRIRFKIDMEFSLGQNYKSQRNRKRINCPVPGFYFTFGPLWIRSKFVASRLLKMQSN